MVATSALARYCRRGRREEQGIGIMQRRDDIYVMILGRGHARARCSKHNEEGNFPKPAGAALKYNRADQVTCPQPQPPTPQKFPPSPFFFSSIHFFRTINQPIVNYYQPTYRRSSCVLEQGDSSPTVPSYAFAGFPGPADALFAGCWGGRRHVPLDACGRSFCCC